MRPEDISSGRTHDMASFWPQLPVVEPLDRMRRPRAIGLSLAQ